MLAHAHPCTPMAQNEHISTTSGILNLIISIKLSEHSSVFVGICEPVNIANGRVTYDRTPDANGKYREGTIRTLTCNNGKAGGADHCYLRGIIRHVTAYGGWSGLLSC